MENDGSNIGPIVGVQDYSIIGSFTQLVIAPNCDDDILQVDDLSSICKLVR